MKNNIKQIPTSLIMIVILAIIITSYYTLPSGYIALPDYIMIFRDLDNREVVDFIRYMYKGLCFGVIYGIVNEVTKQIYIGSTRVPEKRVYEHLVSGINSNLYLQNSIAYYGIVSFQFLILQVIYEPLIGMSLEETLIAAEQRFIDLFPADQLFNISLRASGGGGPKSEEEKEHMRLRMKGVNLGRAPINKGVPLTKAARKQMLTGSAHRSHLV